MEAIIIKFFHRTEDGIEHNLNNSIAVGCGGESLAPDKCFEVLHHRIVGDYKPNYTLEQFQKEEGQ